MGWWQRLTSSQAIGGSWWRHVPPEHIRRRQTSKKAKDREKNDMEKPRVGAVSCLARPGEDGECGRKRGGSLEVGPSPKQKVGSPL